MSHFIGKIQQNSIIRFPLYRPAGRERKHFSSANNPTFRFNSALTPTPLLHLQPPLEDQLSLYKTIVYSSVIYLPCRTIIVRTGRARVQRRITEQPGNEAESRRLELKDRVGILSESRRGRRESRKTIKEPRPLPCFHEGMPKRATKSLLPSPPVPRLYRLRSGAALKRGHPWHWACFLGREQFERQFVLS